MNDRFTKTLLVLIAVALWAMLLRPQPAPPAPPVRQPSNATQLPVGTQPPVVTHLAGPGSSPRFLTISKNKISLWKIRLSEEGRDRLKLQDVQPLP